MYCDICTQKRKKLIHLAIYVFGSEGINICRYCQRTLAEYIMQLRVITARAKKEGYKAGKNNK